MVTRANCVEQHGHQYTGVESFRHVGEFVPLQTDRQGQVIREVALASFGLPLPEQPGQELEVRVALIRDLRRLVPKVPSSEEEDPPLRWDEKPDETHEYWLDENWQATPLPAPPMEPKLIPIVTTAAEADAVELVQTYTRRWPAQENVIGDWLIPLGIEMYELENHKDQVMTVCKVALANLGMWVRDRYFPASYAHAGWHRLQPFFQLPGRIFWERDRVEVELKPLNDRALNRDLEALCAKVAQEQLRLPDGRSLLFRMQGAAVIPLLDAQENARLTPPWPGWSNC
jgi:hypothetical protein